jgi:hypothetical protein
MAGVVQRLAKLEAKRRAAAGCQTRGDDGSPPRVRVGWGERSGMTGIKGPWRLPRRHSELCPECGSPALIFVHWPPAET